MADDEKPKDHRIRLNDEELTVLGDALGHMRRQHAKEAINEGENLTWDSIHLHQLSRRLYPKTLGSARRW